MWGWDVNTLETEIIIVMEKAEGFVIIHICLLKRSDG
jgi:hypothetical protein